MIETRNPYISVGTFNREPRYSQISLNIIISLNHHKIRFSIFGVWYKEAMIETRNPFISVGTFKRGPRYSQISLTIIIS